MQGMDKMLCCCTRYVEIKLSVVYRHIQNLVSHIKDISPVFGQDDPNIYFIT